MNKMNLLYNKMMFGIICLNIIQNNGELMRKLKNFE